MIIERTLKNMIENKKFTNVYFVNGNAYAGKSTLVKYLANKYNAILCEENYHNQLVNQLDAKEYPNLTYTRDLDDWSKFIRRKPSEYNEWIEGCNKECTILEIKILEELCKTDKIIFVDTNISLEKLKEISDINHVLIMLEDIDVSVNRFFDRPDKDKQFLYQLLLRESNPTQAINNFKECLKLINSEKKYNEFLNSGFNVIKKDNNRTIEETCLIAERFFKLI